MSYAENMTFGEVSAVLGYDPETGKFWWKSKVARKILIGMEAGCIKPTRKNANGESHKYRYIKVGKFSLPAARLAWLLHHGEWPQGRLRFRDKDSLNTKIENLEISESVIMPFDHSDLADRAAYLREHREDHPMYWKDAGLRNKFGITLAEYGEMLVKQGGVCAICERAETDTRNGKVKALAVDHDHETGVVRALLCVACNTGLGKFRDDPELLLKAKKYLDHHSGASKPVLLKEVT